MSRHDVFWQAHRGGGGLERPDNTLASARHGWQLGGIPEFDIRTTHDGVIFCLHDSTLARTTNAPEALRSRPAGELTWDEIAPWDAGLPFDAQYAGERVPTLAEVFADMAGKPERLAYLDIKQVDLAQLAALIDGYGVGAQLIVCSPKREQCADLRGFAKGVRTMQWIGGSREQILATFADTVAASFAGLDQVQFHLNDAPPGDWPWTLTPDDLCQGLATCAAAGIDLEVLPWRFTPAGIHALLDLGLRWYATDEPTRFAAAVAAWQPAS